MVSGSFSLPCSGYFSPFLHSTGTLSVSWKYLALPGGPGGFRQDSSCPALLRILLNSCSLTCTQLSCSMVSLSKLFQFATQVFDVVLQPRLMLCNTAGLGFCAFARHYLRNHFCFLFLRVMRCFSSPGLPYALRSTDIAVSGLPHSDIRGSRCICHSPRLFAAYHVLRRLQEPRHPSCALLSFLFFFAF